MKTTVLFSALLMILTLVSCNKDDFAQAKFQVKQVTSATKSSQASTFTFSKALFGISEIDFEIETGTEDQEYEYDGPFQFNVLTETSSPTINTIEIAPGSYHELEFQIDEVLSSGNSIEISGTCDDGTQYQFEFTTTFDEDYDIQNTTGIEATIGQTVNFVLQINLTSLFDGVDFSEATMDNDDIIRINSDSNSNLASIIENNLDDALDFDND